MNSSTIETTPRAQTVTVSESELIVALADGRSISVPLAWFPRLLNASIQDRNRFELLGDGEGIHWPTLDEDISVEGLLAGRRSRSN